MARNGYDYSVKGDIVRIARELRLIGKKWEDIHSIARGMGYKGKRNALCMLVARTKGGTPKPKDFEGQLEVLINRAVSDKIGKILSGIFNKAKNS